MTNLPIARVERFEVDPRNDGERLDRYLARSLETLSRSEVQRLVKAGLVAVEGVPILKSAHRLTGGDFVTVQIPKPQPQALIAESIPLTVLYEDDDLVAIDKPAGMVVHPAHSHETGTLINAALARWPQIANLVGEGRPGIVHRLDKDTSGVIVLAKTPSAFRALQDQFKHRIVRKHYVALAAGIPDNPDGVIDAPLGRDPRQRKRMAVVRRGRPALTRYHVAEKFRDYALLDVYPLTGRTHQIRVHLAWMGYPVVGDKVYGHRKQRFDLPRHFLHAAQLTLRSPSGGHELVFSAPLPEDLTQVLEILRQR